jgi:hypothetical protein
MSAKGFVSTSPVSRNPTRTLLPSRGGLRGLLRRLLLAGQVLLLRRLLAPTTLGLGLLRRLLAVRRLLLAPTARGLALRWLLLAVRRLLALMGLLGRLLLAPTARGLAMR